MDFLSPTPAPLLGDKAIMPMDEGAFCKWWHFAVGMALSGAAGIRATLPVFVLSLLHQIEPDQFPLSDPVHWFRRPEICILLGVVLLLEILADQIPALDHALHAILTPAHPLMGAAAAIAPDYCGGLYTHVPMAFVGGALAGAVHTGKVLARAGSTGSTGGMLNPVMSHCESASAVSLVVLSIVFPILALFASLLFLLIGYLGFKWTRQALSTAGEEAEPMCRDAEAGLGGQRKPSAPSAPSLEKLVDYGDHWPQRRSADAPPQDGGPRAEAQGEIERVLAAPNLHWVLGGGTSAQTRQEYQRLVRLLHPERGCCSGERATAAMQRVMEAHNVLHAGS